MLNTRIGSVHYLKPAESAMPVGLGRLAAGVGVGVKDLSHRRLGWAQGGSAFVKHGDCRLCPGRLPIDAEVQLQQYGPWWIDGWAPWGPQFNVTQEQ